MRTLALRSSGTARPGPNLLAAAANTPHGRASASGAKDDCGGVVEGGSGRLLPLQRIGLRLQLRRDLPQAALQLVADRQITGKRPSVLRLRSKLRRGLGRRWFFRHGGGTHSQAEGLHLRPSQTNLDRIGHDELSAIPLRCGGCRQGGPAHGGRAVWGVRKMHFVRLHYRAKNGRLIERRREMAMLKRAARRTIAAVWQAARRTKVSASCRPA
jgi:hypothetical protein